jgi:predicted negative regulator of RcsB-dependent stress response
MTAPLTPDQARSWFSTLYSLTEKSTPITLMFLLIAGALFGWVITKRQAVSDTRLKHLYDQFVASKDAQIAKAEEYALKLAEIVAHCNPRPP